MLDSWFSRRVGFLKTLVRCIGLLLDRGLGYVYAYIHA